MLAGGGVVSLVGAGGKTSLMFRLARELAGTGKTVLTTTTTKILKPEVDQSAYLILSGSVSEIIRNARSLLKKSLHLTAASDGKDTRKLVGYGPEIIDELAHAGLFRWILVEADGASRMPLKAPADHEPVIPASTGWLIGVVGLDAVGKPLKTPFVFRPERYADVTGVPLGGTVSEASVATVLAADDRGIMKGGPSDAVRLVFLNKADDSRRIRAGRKIAELLGRKDKGRLKRVVMGTALGKIPVAAVWDLNGEAIPGAVTLPQ